MTAPMRREQTSVRRTTGPMRVVDEGSHPAREGLRLVVKRPGGVSLLHLEDIDCLEAEGNVVVVHTATRERHRLREPLSNLLDRLSGHGFIRIHRGAVVRAAAITGVEKGKYRKAYAVLRSGARLEIGRAEFTRLRALWQPGILDLTALGASLQLIPAEG